MFELVEELLDQVALAVERGIDRALNFPVSLRWDVAPPAARRDQLEDRAGVISPVRDDISGGGMSGKQVSDRRLVRCLPGRQRDRQRQSAMIHHRVDLGAQSATRAAKGVIGPPFLAAACWCARMIEESMNCMLSGDFSASVSKIWTQTPAFAHLLNRL